MRSAIPHVQRGSSCSTRFEGIGTQRRRTETFQPEDAKGRDRTAVIYAHLPLLGRDGATLKPGWLYGGCTGAILNRLVRQHRRAVSRLQNPSHHYRVLHLVDKILVVDPLTKKLVPSREKLEEVCIGLGKEAEEQLRWLAEPYFPTDQT